MSTKKLQILDSLIKQAENADTLDGKHADEFAAASDVETLKMQVENIQENAYDDTAVRNLISTNASDIAALEGLIGDTKVATQIDNAIDAIDYPVDSVNGKTGAVVLSASDVGALPADTAIPSIAGLATETYVDGKIETVNTELDTKVDKVSGKGLSTNDYTTTEKNKLAGIAEGANKTTVDSALSSSSTNPVQNKVVNAAISSLNTLVGDEPVSDQITTAIANKSDVGHTHDDRYYTESEIDSKLSGKSDTGHTHSAYVNQNAFSKVTVGSTTIEADSATDTLTLAAGNNITLTPDASGDKVTIAATDTIYTHPSSGVTAGTYKSVTVNAQGHVTAGSNPTTLSGYGITDAAAKSHSHSAATTSTAGFMSATDKAALDEVVDLVGDTSVAEQIEEAIASKSDVGHTHTATEVGADPSGSAASALTSAKSYTDTKISNLINSAPTTLDTLGEIATAMEENADVVAALEESIGTKASASDLTAHTGNKSNPHGVTLSQLGVTATAAELNYVDGVTSNVQTQLNAKVPTSRTVNGKALSANITLSASDVGADASGAANTALTNAKAYTDAEITEWVGDATVSEQIATAIAGKSDSSHTHDDRYYTESEINTKLSGKSDTSHTHSAYVNQNAFSNVVVGSTTIAADSATDTLTLAAGSNITLTPDASGDKVTIAATDTVYTHPNSGVTAGTYKSVTVNAQGHVTGGSNPTTLSGYGITDAATKTELNAVSTLVGDTAVSEQIDEAFDGAITGLSVSGKTITYTKGDGSTGSITTQDTNTTYSAATTSAAGLMSASDKSKLDGIAAGANAYTHPSYTARTGVPTANQTPAFGGTFSVSQPVSDATGHITAVNSRTITIPSTAATTSAAGLMSAADKTKLDGIATGANKITIDSALSSTSTNPVQNKVVNTAISNLNTLVGDTAVSEQISDAFDDAITGLSVSGKTITYTKGDGTSGTITTQDTNTTYSAATTSADGLMSKTDKSKLDNVDTYATSIPFVAGTQTAATGTWTGTTSEISSLVDGQTIRYWLPYKGSGNATLNLTLSDGTTTGAINCYYNGATRLTTHYAAGNVILLTYRENVSIAGSSTTYTGWWAQSDYGDGNYYDRIRYQQAIKCGTTAIVAANIVVGNNGVYQHLKSGSAFDITYPILYADAAIAASSTGTANYLVRSFTITTTQSITLTAYKPVFIKGSLSGTIFTPVSTTPLTQTVPTSADGYEYILLGTAHSSTAMYLLPEHPIFAYKGGAFGQISSKGITDLSVSGKTITYTRGDGTTGTITTQDTTYSAATTSAAGLMSAADKTTLNTLNTLVGDTSVSSQISTAIASKQDTITGAATTITGSNLTASRALVSDSSGKVAVSAVTSTELGYLDGVTSAIQTQLDGKAATSHGTHVSYSTTAPVMDGTASVGSASTVARSDHKHPTDTTRAAASDVTALQELVGDTAVSTQISTAIANSKADWSQNDETADDYVKNRTHWVGNDVLLIDNCQIDPIYGTVYVLATPFSEYPYTISDGNSNYLIPFQEGDVCVVSLDSITYTCTVGIMNNWPYIGNPVLLGGEVSNEIYYPFCITPGLHDGSNGGYATIAASSQLSNPVLTITRLGSIHQLDNKFIDTETIATRKWIDDNRTHWAKYTEDIPILTNYTMNLTYTNMFYTADVSGLDLDYYYTDSTGDKYFVYDGDICTVIWDGIAYTCTAWVNSDDCIYIGDHPMMPDRTTPFCIACASYNTAISLDNKQMSIMCYTMPTSLLLTISRKNAPSVIEDYTMSDFVQSDDSSFYFSEITSDNFEIDTPYLSDYNEYFYVREGDEYVVIFNGIQYICTCHLYDDDYYLTLGNQSIYNSSYNLGNGEPFCIVFQYVSDYDGKALVCCSTPPTSMLLTIKHISETEYVHKLDNKYLNIDTELNSESENPVQNKAIKAYIDETFLGGAW